MAPSTLIHLLGPFGSIYKIALLIIKNNRTYRQIFPACQFLDGWQVNFSLKAPMRVELKPNNSVTVEANYVIIPLLLCLSCEVYKIKNFWKSSSLSPSLQHSVRESFPIFGKSLLFATERTLLWILTFLPD